LIGPRLIPPTSLEWGPCEPGRIYSIDLPGEGIAMSHRVDSNYRRRAEPADVIAALKALKK
jgi:hypothetical protein